MCSRLTMNDPGSNLVQVQISVLGKLVTLETIATDADKMRTDPEFARQKLEKTLALQVSTKVSTAENSSNVQGVKQVGPKCLVIGNLPKPFLKLTFIKLLEKFCERKQIEKTSKNYIEKWKYCQESKSLLVEFTSPSIVTELKDKQTLKLFNNTLSVETAGTIHHETTVTNASVFLDVGSGFDDIEVGTVDSQGVNAASDNHLTIDDHAASENHLSIDNHAAYDDSEHGNFGFPEQDPQNDVMDGPSLRESCVKDSYMCDLSPPRKRLDNRSTPIKDLPSKHGVEGKSRKHLNTFFDNMSVVSKLSANVNVSKLPDGFSEGILLYVLNNCLYTVNYCDRTTKPAANCKKTGRTSAIVEFTSVEAASKVCKLNSARYTGILLTLEQEEIIPDVGVLPDLLNKIRVYGLPCDFKSECLLYELNNCFYMAEYCARTTELATSCKRSGPNTAIVEYISVEAATALIDLKTAEYEGIPLTLEQEEVIPQLTDKVVIDGLPRLHYCKDVLLYLLNNSLYDTNYCVRTIKPAIACNSNGPNSAVVEFMSVDAATAIADFKTGLYNGFPFTLTQQKTLLPPVSSAKLLDKVRLFNVPSSFSEDKFIDHIKNILVQGKLVPANHNIELNLLENNPHDNSAVIQSVDTATKFCRIPNFMFEEHEILRFQLDSDDEQKSMTSSTMTAPEPGSDLADQMNNSLSMVVEDDMNNNYQTASEEMSELETEGEILAFIRILTKHRNDRPSAKWCDIYHLTVGDLESQFDIITNSLFCEKRRNSLSDAFRKQKKKYGTRKIDSDLFCAIAKMRQEEKSIACMTVGHAPGLCPANKLNDEKLISNLLKKDKNNPIKHKPLKLDQTGYFSKGSFMNVDATKALIQCVGDHEDNFDGVVRNERVWDKVAEDMAENGFKYDRNVMKKCLDSVVTTYKNYKDVKNRTGGGRVDWVFYKDMLKLMSGNAASEPMLTASVGSTSSMVARVEISHKNKRKSKQVVAPSVSKPTQSLQESIAFLVQHITAKGNNANT